MAVYYFLEIECGVSEENAKFLLEYLKDKTITLSDGGIVPLSSGYMKDELGNWWVEVIPDKLNYGSPSGSDYRLVDYFTGEVTQALYELLKSAPSFRYALAGYEIEFFILFDELEDCLKDGCFEGLILSEELWQQFGKHEAYVPFSEGYMWHPYLRNTPLGEDMWFREYIMMKEFRVNEYITLRLENGDSNIFVNEKMINQCKNLLLNIPDTNMEITTPKEFRSVDEEQDYYLDSSKTEEFIPTDTEFWGHCSNLQGWAENNYDTNLLDRSIAFPILKELVKLGDSKAKEVFKSEVKKRIESNYVPVQSFLIVGGYLRIFSEAELKELTDGMKKHLNSLDDEDKEFESKEISEAFRNSIYSLYRSIHRDDKKVIRLCEIAIEFDENNTNAWYEMALSYSFMGDYDKAEKFYKRALEINPDDTISLGNLCDIYLKQDRNQDIINLLGEDLLDDIMHSGLRVSLSKAYYNLGELKKALEQANIAFNTYPTGWKVKELREELMKKLNL